MFKKKYYVLILIGVIALLSTLGTYAWWKWSSNVNPVVHGEICVPEITFQGGNTIDGNNMLPVRTKEDGLTKNINIKLDTTCKNGDTVLVDLKLKLDTFPNGLANSSFKWELYNGLVLVSSGNFNGKQEGDIIELTNDLEVTQSISTYTLYIYIDANMDNPSTIGGNTFTFSLYGEGINALQRASNFIKNLYTSASKTQYTDSKYNITYNYATSVNLMNDRLASMSVNADAGNIRYYGADPNNYVYFNGELWRIIGVFDGKLKIIRNESIGAYSWDTSGADVNYGYGINQWGPSTHSTDDSAYDGADLMKLLNPGYSNNTDKNCIVEGGVTFDGSKFNCGDNTASNYENILVNNSLYWNKASGKCYDYGNYRTKDCDFTTTGLKNEETKNMIAEVVWNLGSNSRSDSIWNDMMTASKMYEWEHSNNSGIQCTKSSSYCSTDVVGTTTWSGKVGLISPSDYAYATGGGSHGLNTCLSKHAGYVESDTIQNWINTYTGCISDDWLKISGHQWTMSPCANSSKAYYVFNVDSSGYVYHYNARYAYSVRPVVFLNSDVLIDTDGRDGTASRPYGLK